MTWPTGGHFAILFSGDTPDQLRGPQFHKAWVDELAKYQYPQEAWDNLEFGLRLGNHPQVVVTTTPRPIPIIKNLLEDDDVVLTRGSSYENIANLAPTFIRRVLKRYEGTRVGRQELHAELLTDVPGALWTYDLLEQHRVKALPEMVRIIVAVDPAVTSMENSDETGIIVCGKGVDNHGYVLRDYSRRVSPNMWAKAAVSAYHEWEADRIIAETNNGGDLVEATIRTVDPKVSFKKVQAARGKVPRAEPVAALYEQGKIHHYGQFAVLEDQQTSYTADGYMRQGRIDGSTSPDRLDALVWGMTELMVRPVLDLDPKGWKGLKR
jgi:phage terminase large subunit-like protein